MEDISHVKITNGVTYDIRDYRVPVLPKSENVYLRGDGTWQIPVNVSGSGVIMVDAGDHLLIKISDNSDVVDIGTADNMTLKS